MVGHLRLESVQTELWIKVVFIRFILILFMWTWNLINILWNLIMAEM